MSDELRHLYLGHLSRDCNRPELAFGSCSDVYNGLAPNTWRWNSGAQDVPVPHADALRGWQHFQPSANGGPWHRLPEHLFAAGFLIAFSKMSKAFTRESDDLLKIRHHGLQSLLPPGVRNFLTPDGAHRFQEELNRLVEDERPRLAATAADSREQRHQLQALDSEYNSYASLCTWQKLFQLRPSHGPSPLRSNGHR